MLRITCGFAQVVQKNCAKLKFRFMRNFRKKYFQEVLVLELMSPEINRCLHLEAVDLSTLIHLLPFEDKVKLKQDSTAFMKVKYVILLVCFTAVI